MDGVTHKEFGEIKDHVEQLEKKVGNLQSDLNRRIDSLEGAVNELKRTNESNLNLLIEKMNGSEIRVVNKLWGIVVGTVTVGITVLGVVIGIFVHISSKGTQPVIFNVPSQIPYQTQSSIQPAPVQPLIPQQTPAMPPQNQPTPSSPPTPSPTQ